MEDKQGEASRSKMKEWFVWVMGDKPGGALLFLNLHIHVKQEGAYVLCHAVGPDRVC